MAKAEAASFETEWRAIAPIVERDLARRGVPKWLLDDVVQETALRLYRCWDTVDPDRSPVGLALTIAHNALWDERNRRRVVELPGVLPDTAAKEHVEDAGLARVELRRVGRVLSQLSPAHRSVLLAEVGQCSFDGGKDATKMLRLRARRKMRSLLDAASVGAFIGFPRSMWRSLRAARGQAVTAAAPTLMVAACGILVLLGPASSPLLPGELERADRRSIPASEGRYGSQHANDAKTGSGSGAATRTSTRRSRPARAEQPERERGSYWQVGIGDDGSPVGGGAGLGISPDPQGEQVRPPECSASRPSENEAEVECTATAGGQEATAAVTVEVRP